ncbi:DUF2798 domain-containing protein [Salibacterium halotolerans]|uniref:DUF2798 domain-containing protein n=1 Tax=Salibacterium halotolerans TaxID=1884432 RepID=A0A1I5LDY4_9BACI|nr:DUF2798 domain-containing protein [Salibacterium halotolerans]SFO95422.1 Protein of unknown function [Salibacterium halotolerans]
MPETRKESWQFGFMMCFGMVLVMTLYNLYINDMLSTITFTEGTFNFLTAFVIAFMLDMFVVSPYAKKTAGKAVGHTGNKVYMILAVSTCMVIGMAFFMSIYGLITAYMHTGFQSGSILLDYLNVFGKNFVMALPLQIVVMGPLVRYLFTNFIKTNAEAKEV